MGGSICDEAFTDIPGIHAIWIRHFCRGCPRYARNEHVQLPMSRDALAIMAGIYWDLGNEEVPHP